MQNKIKLEIQNNADDETVYQPIDKISYNPQNNADNFNLFNAVNKYYSLYESCKANNDELNTSFAVELCNHVISSIKNRDITLTKDKRLPQSFYNACVNSFFNTNPFSSCYDPELIEIYIKQTVLILKKAGILYFSGVKVKVLKRDESVPVFLEIFDAFWNKNDWETLFPSDINAAIQLKNKRTIFRKHLLKIKSSFKVESLANKFFTETGFAEKNNLLMISFIDFYLITWLSHFGILKYDTQKTDKSVYIQLTETGRTLLSILTED